MFKLAIVFFTLPLFVAACMTNEVAGVDGDLETFNIAANTTSCQGVAPMRCLIVNGKFFYDPIDGYEHVEGQSATICTIASSRPEPLPSDVGSHEYRRVPCN
jgi:hypothetical protein